MSERFNPVSYLAEMISRAPARPTRLAMVWAYFDETVTHTVDGKPDQLLVGGCVSSLEKWKALEADWRQALTDENVTGFHAKDFYQFRKEFEWFKPDGEKDWPRHEAFRDRLADIIIEHVEEAISFASAVWVGATERAVYKRAYRDGALRAMNQMSRRVFRGKRFADPLRRWG